jgi:hypothetical protein
MFEGDKIELNYLYVYSSYKKLNHEYNRRIQSEFNKSNSTSNESNINKYTKIQTNNKNTERNISNKSNIDNT